MAGRAVVLATVQPSGRVSEARVSSSVGLDDEGIECFRSVVSRAKFHPRSREKGSLVAIPVRFVQNP